jgi:gliding motility-associated transport system permease protein
MMRNTFSFCAKELKIQFASPVAYVVLTGFLMLAGFFFYDLFTNFSRILSYASSYQDPTILNQVNFNDLVITPLFQNMNVLLLLVVPLITMRAFAEEKRQGTDELILTSPVGISEFVWGKFLASFLFFGLLLLLTVQFPLILAQFGEIDWGKVAAGYLGLLLMGTAFISLGLFASSLTKSQMVAAVGGFSALLMFWIIGWMAESVMGTAGQVLKFLSLTNHFESFVKGAINTKDLVFYCSFIFFFLFLSTRSVESTRWR